MKMVIGKVGVGQTQERRSRAPVPERPCQGRGGGGHRFHRGARGAWGEVVKGLPDSFWGAHPSLAGPSPPGGAAPSLGRDGRTESSEFSVLPPHHHPDLVSSCHERKTFSWRHLGQDNPKGQGGKNPFPAGPAWGSSSFMAIGSAQAFGVNSPFHTDNWGS